MLITIRSLKERRFAGPKGEERPGKTERREDRKEADARGDGPEKERDEICLHVGGLSFLGQS